MIPILRKRLTKKEYKYLQMISQESTMEEICEKLGLTPEEIESLKEKLIKKLNQEKLKQELMR
jgi:DNA-binding CsgD family transcriptional regulator